jgi:polyhydroxyalkanoate synthesis regulator phasin
MRTKTILELLTISAGIYHFAKDTQLLERISTLSEKGKDGLNELVSETMTDEDGNEMEFVDKVIFKTAQLKKEFEEKVEELVTVFYEKVNIAHTDQVKALTAQLEQSSKDIALLEARLNKLETKQ